MATDTFESRQISRVECEPCVDDFFTAGDSSMKPGYFFYFSSGNTIKIATADQKAAGIILHRDGYQHDKTTIRDIDDAYQINDPNVRVALISANQGKTFWGMIAANNAIRPDYLLRTAASGMAQKQEYVDGDRSTDSHEETIGRPKEYHASNSDNKLRKIILGM